MHSPRRPNAGDHYIRSCKNCNVTLIFIANSEGKWMPCENERVDSSKLPDGDLLVTKDGATMRAGLSNPQFFGYRPHWAKCPAATSFRKKK